MVDSLFDDIRCFNDDELQGKFDELFQNQQFLGLMPKVFPNVPLSEFIKQIKQIRSVYQFQKNFIVPFLVDIENKTSKGVTLSGLDLLNYNSAYLFISNHRDIVLDSALLNIHLLLEGMNTSEIAIGNNLLVYPWIEDLVRINKSFIVRRDASIREQIKISTHLSEYIRYVLTKKPQSVWLAQREGRAKDGNDKTQPAIIKMLQMSGSGSFSEKLRELNIVPLTINYEYDSCDFLKAKELQQKRDDENFKKSQQDDLFSMETGMMGIKGRISFCISEPLNNILQNASLDSLMAKDQAAYVASLIDEQIYKNYRLYEGNYVAADLLSGENRFSSKYTEAEKNVFLDYVQKQLDKIQLENKDEEFLREKIYCIYANPVFNQEIALNKK